MEKEEYRDLFLKMLESRARAGGLEQGATVSEFMAALPSPWLLGVQLPEDVRKFLANYTRANIAGGTKLREFTVNVTARLPDSFLDQTLVPGKERPTVADAVWLARTAVARLGLTANGENHRCTPLSELPLAA